MEKEKEQEKATVKFNFGKFCKLCLRRWRWFVVGVIGCLLVACAYLYIRTPKSEVVASLKLPPETSSGGIMAISDLASSFSLGDMLGGSSTDNEVAMLSSHSVYMKTVKDLGLNVACFEKLGPLKWAQLYGNQMPFSLTPAVSSVNDTISRAIIFKIEPTSAGTFDISAKIKRKTVFKQKGMSLPATVATAYGQFVIDTTAAYATRNPDAKAYRFTFASYNAAAQSYAKLIKIYAPDKKTDFIALSYLSPDPQYGELLLSTLIANYNLVCTEQRNEQDSNTLGFVDKRLATLEEQLAQTEERMETFKKVNNLTDVEVDATTLVTTSSELERTLLWARVECEALQMARDFVSNQENKYSLIPSLGSGESSAAPSAGITAYNDLIIQRMRMLDATTPNNSALKRLDAQIDAMRQSVIESLDRSYDQAKIKLNELASKTSSMSSRLSTLPTLEREYIGIERDLVLQQQLYLFLLKQREEASMSLSQATPSLITVDEPYMLTEPIGVSTKMALALAVLMGGFIPLVLLYFFKYKHAPLIASDVEGLSQVSVLAMLKQSGDALPVLNPDSGESVRQLRAEVMRIFDCLALEEFEGVGPMSRSVIVASPYDGEGKTYTATNLAVSLALVGKKVLLIEADLSKGNQPVLGYELEYGIADLTTRGASACVQEVDLGNGASLYLLGPGNVGDGNADDIVGHESVKTALSFLEIEYQYIIIDTPSYSSHSTAFELANLAKLTLCPVAAGVSTVASVDQANALADDGRMPRVTIVVNKA